MNKNMESPTESIHTKWDIYLPIRFGFNHGSRTDEDIQAAIDDLVESEHEIHFTFNKRDFKVDFQVAGPPDFFPDYSDTPLDTLLRKFFVIVRATAEGSHDVENLYDSQTGQIANDGFPLESRVQLSKEAGAGALRDFMFEIVMASNIARPGVFMPEGGAVFIDGKKLREDVPRWLNPIEDSFERTKQINWPELRDIPFPHVWHWLNAVPNFHNGFGSTNLGRALAAYSYLFGSSIDSDQPFGDGLWAILGLEAIYGEGTEQISRQLVERTNAFLGKQITHQSALKKMYSFRSQFVHGDIDFPYAHWRFSSTKEIDSFYDDSGQSSALAIRVLVATLQKMASEGRYDLAFRTEVV